MTWDNGREAVAEQEERSSEAQEGREQAERPEQGAAAPEHPLAAPAGEDGEPDGDAADEELWGDVEARLAALKEQLAPLCESKAEELVLWGYEQVEPDLIWEMVAEEARKNRALHLHQVANAILTLKPNRLMNHLMKALYRR